MAKKNSRLYSDGNIEKYFSDTDIIPSEFYPVKIIYINDGINNKRWYSNKEIPDGYVIGKLPLSRNWNVSQHKHHSEETKKKISEARKAQGSPWSRGFRHSEETKKHLSEIRQGTSSPFKGIKLTEEQKKTRNAKLIEKYGSLENFYKARTVNYCLKYKTNPPTSLHIKDYSEELYNIYDNRELSIEFLTKHKMTRIELAEYFSCPIYVIDWWSIKLDLREYINHPAYSQYEDEIANLFPDIYFERCDRKILHGKELDLYSPIYKIAIEFNGNYWHSDLHISDHNYHQIKSKLCEEQGIRLIHIYEYEWNDERTKKIIISLLNSCFHSIPNVIYARKCEIKELSNKDVKDFINENHLQGHRNAQIILGLFYNDELLQVMSFSKNRKYQWEIIRECTKLDTLIVGGVSKLFSYFVRNYSPTEIFSYCDYNKFTGKSYEKLGMKFIGLTQPDLKFIINGQVYTRNPYKNKEQEKLSEAKLFGSGSKKYLWRDN